MSFANDGDRAKILIEVTEKTFRITINIKKLS